MLTYTDLLPPSKSETHGAFTWTPATDNATSPVAGTLTLTGKRSWCRYHVSESPADMPGRAFVLVKVDAGSDETQGHYNCFMGKHGEQICECRGWAYSGACKHLAAIASLIEAGKL